MSTKSGYKSIFKGVVIFGGVQFLQIFISLIRGKATAYFLGPEGMGISGLLTSSLAMVITIAGLGCNVSCVKYLSTLNKEDSSYGSYIKSAQAIFIFIGLGGVLLTCLLSPLLSSTSFSSYEYIASYLVLSLYVMFSLYSSGLSSIFQGLQELKTIASGNIFTLLLGTICSIGMYFLFGRQAIVPVIIIPSFLSAVFFHFTLGKRVLFKKDIVSDKKLILFKDFVSLGLPMVLGSLMGNFTVYIINAFLSSVGSISDIGLYNAGMSISNQYIGLLFTAMGTDYFPRLASVVHSKDATNEVVNQQGEIVILFALPLLSLMMISAPLLIRILLSPNFFVIETFIRIIAFGMFFKAISFCLGYISFAKGDKKTYLLFEAVIANILTIVLNCCGYYFGRLEGLAWSFLILYVVYYLMILFVCRIKYHYVISKELLMLSVIAGLSLTIVFLLTFINSLFEMMIAIGLTVGICIFSLFQLDKRIGLKDFVNQKVKLKCKK